MHLRERMEIPRRDWLGKKVFRPVTHHSKPSNIIPLIHTEFVVLTRFELAILELPPIKAVARVYHKKYYSSSITIVPTNVGFLYF